MNNSSYTLLLLIQQLAIMYRIGCMVHLTPWFFRCLWGRPFLIDHVSSTHFVHLWHWFSSTASTIESDDTSIVCLIPSADAAPESWVYITPPSHDLPKLTDPSTTLTANSTPVAIFTGRVLLHYAMQPNTPLSAYMEDGAPTSDNITPPSNGKYRNLTLSSYLLITLLDWMSLFYLALLYRHTYVRFYLLSLCSTWLNELIYYCWLVNPTSLISLKELIF